MPKDQKKSRPTPRKAKPNVRFTAKPETDGKCKGSPSEGSSPKSSRKKPRTMGSQEPAAGKSSTSEGSTSGSAAAEGNETGNSAPAANADQGTKGTADVDAKAPPKKHVRNQFGIHPKEVPKEAKPTQRGFQRVIRAMCGLYTQHDVLPSAAEKRDHYDKRFDKVDDYRLHMRSLVDESRTAVKEGIVRATKLIRDVKAVSGPIANDIARIPAEHLATVFTMVQKAGLQGFCPDIEGPAYSTYNQLHRHLAVSAFQFLSSSFALMALNVNNHYAQDHNLCSDMYDNFVYGTLAQNTKKEKRRPGSLSHSLRNSVASKARTRLCEARFKTARRLKLRKPVQRMVYINEVHSDDERSQDRGGRRVREKPGRNPIVGRFVVEVLDAKAEEYRERNGKPGQTYITDKTQ
ncbi:hypothetical protein B0H13DRAFT_1897722 [Mycena leptocephala]|nr:hypothetical protein B0H13DRAFT_1897722 [Mycena leptocephala]